MKEEKEKKRKKAAVFIALLVLLVIMTGAFIWTLAKYVTSETVSDDTNAAKFGLNISEEINLFSDSYTNVQADTEGKKIIAPGTSGQYKFEVTGTSEVAYKVSANISVVYSAAWDGYEPLRFSINGDVWTEFIPFCENLSNALESDVIQPNSPYSNTQTIYWKWPFFVSPENDIKDTNIGFLAADGADLTVTVSIEVIASQVD